MRWHRYTPAPGLPQEVVPLEPANIRVSPEGRLDVRYYIEKWVQVGVGCVEKREGGREIPEREQDGGRAGKVAY